MATDIQLQRGTSALDAQKLADRAAIAGALKTPAAIAADIATMPPRAYASGVNAVTRGLNVLLPEGINIPAIPNRPGMFPHLAAATAATAPLPPRDTTGTWAAPPAKAAMPAAAPAPLVPAATAAASPVPAVAAAKPAAPIMYTGTGSIQKTVLNADGTPGKTTTWQGMPPPMVDASGAGKTTAPMGGVKSGPAAGLLDPSAAASAGVDRHVEYTQRILPILMDAARNFGDPRNAGGHLQTLMRAFGEMNLAREYAGGANNINAGLLGMHQAGVQQAGQITTEAMRGQTQRDVHSTDSVQLGGKIEIVNGIPMVVPTFGQRPKQAGMPPTPYETDAPKKPVLGAIYTDPVTKLRYEYDGGTANGGYKLVK